MSGIRFKEGDIVRLIVARSERTVIYVGSECSIYMIRGVDDRDNPKDYGVIMSDGECFAFMDWQLAPINPPAEPASLTRHSEQDVPA